MQPLVTVGVPTFNRAVLCERAVRSALGQTHAALEVVVSDDASTDETPARMRALMADDRRLRYLRQETNLGHARNFQVVLDAARGEYFMWLSDDDWLEPDYVARCLEVLRGPPGHALVAGLARYSSGGDHVVDERPTNLTSARPAGRVLAYLARVNVNGALYGLARRADLERIGFPDVAGGDWLLVAALAAQGQVRTLSDVHIHRSIDGLSSEPRRLASSFGMRGIAARQHHVVVAGRFAREILGSPAYASLSAPQRALTAGLAAALIVLRFPVLTLARSVLRRLRLDWVEPSVARWVRRRD